MAIAIGEAAAMNAMVSPAVSFFTRSRSANNDAFSASRDATSVRTASRAASNVSSGVAIVCD